MTWAAVAGVFSATYALSFSDEDIEGAIGLGDLTLLLTGEVVAAMDDADFDSDNDVNGDDYLIWQRGFGIGTLLSEGDANGNGSVDTADLAIWKQQFGGGRVCERARAVNGPYDSLFSCRLLCSSSRSLL